MPVLSCLLLSSRCRELVSVELFRAEHDARARQIVGRKIHRHLVARQNADIVHPHFPGNVPSTTWPFSSFTRNVALGRVSRISPCIWMVSSLAMLLRYRVGNIPPLKFAFLSKLSY